MFAHVNACKKRHGVMARKNSINRTFKFILVLFGIWPDMCIACITFCKVFWSITLAITLFCHYLYFLRHLHSEDVFDLMDCFSSFLGYFKLIIKCMIFWFNQRIFDEMLKMMAEDWSDCANSDIETRETVNKAKISDHIINAIIALHTFAVLSYGIGIIMDDVDVTDQTIELPYINKIEVPFNINTQYTYKLVLITQLMYIIICSWGIGTLNALLLTLTLHVGGQIDILCYWLAELISEDGNKRESIVVMLNKIIQKHQKIIYFSKNIENLYSFFALLQFASNVVMICILGFLIVTALGNPDATEKIVRSLAYYSVTNLEAFMFCYAGEYIINKSKSIGFAAYSTAWYDMEPKYSRILLFIILRSQIYLTFTVGKMMDLSLQCFATLMNSAGSYLSVLLAMQ